MSRRSFDPISAALLVLGAGAAAIAGAWIYEYLGYAPCELCLKQRFAYYAGVPLAGLAFWAAFEARAQTARALLWLVALLFFANALLAIYHSGVEWKFWPGPADCTGGFRAPDSLSDFQKQLQNVRPVRCDEPALRVFGLSLANWNILISGALAWIAASGARKPA